MPKPKLSRTERLIELLSVVIVVPFYLLAAFAVFLVVLWLIDVVRGPLPEFPTVLR